VRQGRVVARADIQPAIVHDSVVKVAEFLNAFEHLDDDVGVEDARLQRRRSDVRCRCCQWPWLIGLAADQVPQLECVQARQTECGRDMADLEVVQKQC